MRKSGNLFNGIMPKIIVGLCALFFVGTANAVQIITGSCTSVTCTSAIINAGTTEHWPEITSIDVACTGTIEERCYQNTTTGAYAYVRSCTACKDGFELTSTSYSSGKVCTSRAPIYYGCKAECDGCDNCEDTGTWSAGNTGYERRTKKTCNTSTCSCQTGTEYRCAKGYYGKSTNGTSGCTRCPRADSTDLFSPFGTTDSAGSTAITQCYIAAGTGFSDGTGSGIYPEQCDYERDGFVVTSCAIDDPNYCTSNSDCDTFMRCNTTSSCCELALAG